MAAEERTLDWSGLVGQTLHTVQGAPFDVAKVTDKVIYVRPYSSRRSYDISVQRELIPMLEAYRQGRFFPRPDSLRGVGVRYNRVTYAWGLLRALIDEERAIVEPPSRETSAVPLADLTLAQRLEAADAWFKVSYAEAQASLLPELGVAVEPVAGGYAVYAGPDTPLSRAVGLGMNGPVSADELERVERFFHSRGIPARIDLCPLADPSLVEWLNHKGYCLDGFKNVWVRPLSHREIFPAAPPEVHVRAAAPDEATPWIVTVSRGFAGRDEVTPEDLEIATPSFYISTATCFLAGIDNKLVGGGAMATYEGLASFFSASTRVAYRGRGVQTALLHARLTAATAAGCDLAMVHTVPGNASQRNVERLGFRLAYTKMALVRTY